MESSNPQLRVIRPYIHGAIRRRQDVQRCSQFRRLDGKICACKQQPGIEFFFPPAVHMWHWVFLACRYGVRRTTYLCIELPAYSHLLFSPFSCFVFVPQHQCTCCICSTTQRSSSEKKFVKMVARKIMLFGADARWRDGRHVVTNKLIYGRYSMSERQR